MLFRDSLVILLLSVLAYLMPTPVESLHRLGRPISALRYDKSYHLPAKEYSYNYKTLYFDQKIDHLGFAEGKTFKQKYLVADQFWNGKDGPIFFYTGNEGDIELFCNNTGFMWDIAPKFRAMLVFAEHRYYGTSMPFGSESYKNSSTLNYLTSEQALADFATLIRYMKATIPGAKNSKVVAFGGSYGGMLAAWFRIKYPNMVVGSLAASAPILQFTGITPCEAFYDTTSNTFAAASKMCATNIHNSYKTFEVIAGKAGGLELISNIFKLCTPLKSKYDLMTFMDFLQELYVDLAMVDYPYPANFLADLPAWPVEVACSYLTKPLEDEALLRGISQVTNLYFNYTGSSQCIKWDDSGSTPSLGYLGWDYQSCTEMVMPMCSNGSGIFPNIPWDFQSFSDSCYQKFKVRPNQDWIITEYWGKNLESASNIIFSNGLLDPWSSGGVLQTIDPTVIAIQIPYGAHHLDLRSANPKDTRGVIAARQQEVNIIRGWLGITPV